MEKGQVLRGQEFERYFMADIEIVDATIIDFIGEFYLIVKIDDEYHRVSFSLNGAMCSREKLTDYRKEMPAKKSYPQRAKGMRIAWPASPEPHHIRKKNLALCAFFPCEFFLGRLLFRQSKNNSTRE